MSNKFHKKLRKIGNASIEDAVSDAVTKVVWRYKKRGDFWQRMFFGAAILLAVAVKFAIQSFLYPGMCKQEWAEFCQDSKKWEVCAFPSKQIPIKSEFDLKAERAFNEYYPNAYPKGSFPIFLVALRNAGFK